MFTDPATGQKWFAGGSSRNFKCPKDAVLVALTYGLVNMPIMANIPLVPMKDKVVILEWSDGTAGPLKSKNDYIGLLRALRATGQDVAVACMGGHGRTGTFLAMNAWLMGILDGKKPIEFIRDIYCQECVETKVQFELLAKLTGIDETNLHVPYVAGQLWGGGYAYNDNYYGGHSNAASSKKLHFLEASDPEQENKKHGYFWGQVFGGSVTEYFGYPDGEGEWMLDTVGWFWQWAEDNKNPKYIPFESTKKSSKKKPEDLLVESSTKSIDAEAGTFDDDSGYGYPTSDEPKSKSAQQFLNDYYSGKKNQSA